jgi:competence protein ComEC
VGYRNRFGFPKYEVEQRYQKMGARLLRTDNEGAVTFEFSAESKKVSMNTARSKQYFWQKLSKTKFEQ